MRKISMILAAALCLAGCNKNEMKSVTVLGGKPKIVVLPGADAGKGFFDVITNVNYTAQVVKGGQWLKLTGSDEVVVTFDYYANNGFARESRVVLSHQERTDTISIRQAGRYEPFVNLSLTEAVVGCEGGKGSVQVSTNVPDACLMLVVSDPQVKTAILHDNTLSYEVKPTTRKDTKRYSIAVRFINDWGEATEGKLTLIQEPLK